MTDFMSILGNFVYVDMEKKSPLLDRISSSVPKKITPKTPHINMELSNNHTQLITNTTKKAQNSINYIKNRSLKTVRNIKEKINQYGNSIKQRTKELTTTFKNKLESSTDKAANTRNELYVRGLFMTGRLKKSLTLEKDNKKSKKKEKISNELSSKKKRKKRKRRRNREKRKKEKYEKEKKNNKPK